MKQPTRQYETLAQEMTDDIGQDESDGWDEAWYNRNYADKSAEEVIVGEPYCRVHDLFNCWFSHDPVNPDVPDGYTLHFEFNGQTVKLDSPVCIAHGMDIGCMFCERGYDITPDEIKQITRELYARAGKRDPWRVGALFDNSNKEGQ